MGIRLKELVNKIRKSGFIKSVLTLSSGAVIGQGINFIGMPFIGRIYSPDVIGDFTLIVGNSNVVSAVACLGMLTVFMLPKEDEEARGLSRLVLYSSILITSFAVTVLWLIRHHYLLIHTTKTPYYLSLIVLWLFVVLNIISNICYAYVNRHRKYKVMFWNPIISATVNITLSIILGLMKATFLNYAIGSLTAIGANIIHLLISDNCFHYYDKTKYSLMNMLRKYSTFPFFQMPANLINNLSNQVPLQLIEELFSSTELGLYSMAIKILSLPTMLLATPINRVYFQEASSRYNKGEDIGEFSFKILETNIRIAIIPISLLVIFGRQIFRIFLGTQWEMAGYYAAIMGLYQLMLFCVGCLSGDFVIIRKNSWNLISSVFSLAINIILYCLCKYIITMKIETFLMILSITMTIKIILAEAVFFAYVKFSLIRYFGFVIKCIIIPFAFAMLINLLLGSIIL